MTLSLYFQRNYQYYVVDGQLGIGDIQVGLQFLKIYFVQSKILMQLWTISLILEFGKIKKGHQKSGIIGQLQALNQKL